MADVAVTRNNADQRFEARLDGELVGSAFYELAGSMIVFTHTEVDDAVEGHGIGSALARAALDDARDRRLSVVPQCPFIADWIQRHPDYEDLVA